jgi:RimJ/RimL family protein N-acetyltransferase
VRFALRRFTDDDLDRVSVLNADPEVMRYLGKPQSRDEVAANEMPRLTREHFGNLGFWAAFVDGEFIGWFCAEPQGDDEVMIGYRIARRYWDHGYATEGARLMVSYAQASGAKRIFATTMAVNSASRRVLEKAGLHHVRTWHGEWDDPLPGAEQGDVDYEFRSAKSPSRVPSDDQ